MIQEQISRLNTAKGNLKAQINNLGVAVPNTATIDEYASYLQESIGTFDARMTAIENKLQTALYFSSSAVLTTNNLSERLQYAEEKQKDIVYLGG